MEFQEVIRHVLIIASFSFLVIIFIFKKQNKKQNLALFYSSLWTTISLGVINYICVYKNLWQFISKESLYIEMPLDIYFLWIIFWGIIPIYFLKGKYIIIISLIFLWVDIICMPYFEKIGILKLSSNWLIGEFILIATVFIPSYLWGKFSLSNQQLAWRILFQVVTVGLIIVLIIPFLLFSYLNKPFVFKNNTIVNQLFFIIALPSLIAVKDFYKKGKGSPFPLDPTKKLVQIGVYAYIKNPIQWSFTFLFIPLSISYNEPLLLIGLICSFVYTVGISNIEEKNDMTNRFGKLWVDYSNRIPKWYFLWKPLHIPQGTIYFKQDCNQCNQLKKWFFKRKPINLLLKYEQENPEKIQQITYVDYLGNNHKSISGIAHALEHINLIWASLAWLMRLPIVNYILQAIVNAIGFGSAEDYD